MNLIIIITKSQNEDTDHIYLVFNDYIFDITCKI